jgi:hypothetical protein
MHSTPCVAITKDGVLLDVKHDRMLTFNAVALDIWRAIERNSPEAQIVDDIANCYRIPHDRAAHALQALTDRLRALDIWPAHVATTPREAHERVAPSQLLKSHIPYKARTSWLATAILVSRALCGLAAFDVVLSVGSFAALCETVSKWPVSGRERIHRESAVSQVCSAVDNVCVWYPKTALCLQRSAVATCMLRQYGVPARMVVGAIAMPFLAHAWVEVDGIVVNDQNRVNTFYVRIAEY